MMTFEKCNLIPGYMEWLEEKEEHNRSKAYEEYVAEDSKYWIYDHEERELEIKKVTVRDKDKE